MAPVLEANFPEDPVRSQVPGPVKGTGVLPGPGGAEAPLDRQFGPHRRRRQRRAANQEIAGGGPPALGTPPGLRGQEQLHPLGAHPARTMQAAQEGHLSFLGQSGQVMRGKVRLQGLLTERHAHQPEKNQGRHPGRAPGPPDEDQGGPEQNQARGQPSLRQVEAPGRRGNPRHQGQSHRHQGPGHRAWKAVFGFRFAVFGFQLFSLEIAGARLQEQGVNNCLRA